MMCAKSLSSSSIAHRRTSLIIIITLSLFKGEKKEHWMDWAGDAYNAQLIQDIKAMFKVLFMFLPLPVFWSLFDQQGSRWVLQAGQMNGDAGQFTLWHYSNGPLAVRGHVTNASLKQRVVILLLPKIDITHKNYLTAEIWEETHLKEILYGTLICQQSIMICIGCHAGGHALIASNALQRGGQNYFLLISC